MTKINPNVQSNVKLTVSFKDGTDDTYPFCTVKAAQEYVDHLLITGMWQSRNIRATHIYTHPDYPGDQPTPKVTDAALDEVWKCQDGRELLVCDMDEDHVRRVLNMILKKRRLAKKLRRELKAIQLFTDELLDDERKWGDS